MFLGASRGLTRGTVMGMQMRCAIGNGVVDAHMPLESLMQVASLSDVDRNPAPIFGLPGIDVIAG